MTRVEGYRPMFGEAELREVFGPRFTRAGEPIEESPVGGGAGVPPSAAGRQCEPEHGWVAEAWRGWGIGRRPV